jgi:hypothetical protein
MGMLLPGAADDAYFFQVWVEWARVDNEHDARKAATSTN